MQRHATLAVPLATAHLCAVEPAGALNPDALGAGLASGLDGLAHGATEGDAALELLGDGLGDEVGVELGALDLDDVDGDLTLGGLGDLLEVGAETVDLGALLADDDAGTSGVDGDLHLVAGALDVDARKRGARETLLEIRADLDVVAEVLGIVLIGVPTGTPLLGRAETEAGRLYLVTHTFPTPPFEVRRRR